MIGHTNKLKNRDYYFIQKDFWKWFNEWMSRVGDVITNVDKLEGGWWKGALHGITGMFPDNFVKVGGWLIDCLFDWLIDWLFVWLIDLLIDCQVEETDIPGFRSDQQTFFAGNTDFDQILQVGDVPLGGSYLGRFFFIFSFRVKI